MKKSHAIERAFGIAATVFMLASCAASLTPAETTKLGTDVTAMLACDAKARQCKVDGGTDCYAVYDACMKDAGLH